MAEQFEQNIEEQMANLDRDARIQDQTDEIIENVENEKWGNFYNVYEALVRANSLGHITAEQYALKLKQLEEISVKNNEQSLWEKLVPPYDEKDLPLVVEKKDYKKHKFKLPYGFDDLGDETYVKAYPDVLLTAVKSGDGSLGIFQFEYTGRGKSGYSNASEVGPTSREIVDISRIGKEKYLVTSKTEFMEISRRNDGKWDIRIIADYNFSATTVLQAEISDAQYLPNDKALLSLVDGSLMLFDLETLESQTLYSGSGHLSFFSHAKGATFIRESNLGKEDTVYHLDNFSPKLVCKSINDGRIQIQAINKDEVMVSERSGSVDFAFDRYCRDGNNWFFTEEYIDDQVLEFQHLPNGRTVSLTQANGSNELSLTISAPEYEYIKSLNIHANNLQVLPDGRIFCIENGEIVMFDGKVVENG